LRAARVDFSTPGIPSFQGPPRREDPDEAPGPATQPPRAFSLTLHPERTRLIEFGRFAAQNRERRGLGKPKTFKFLSFVFICGKSRRGDFQIRRKSIA
jgi:hypothetical protein